MNKFIIIFLLPVIFLFSSCANDEQSSVKGSSDINQSVNDNTTTNPDNPVNPDESGDENNQDNENNDNNQDNPDTPDTPEDNPDNPDDEGSNDDTNNDNTSDSDNTDTDIVTDNVEKINIDTSYIVITKGFSRDVNVSAAPSTANQTVYYEIKNQDIVNIEDLGSKFIIYGINTGSTQVIFYSYDKKVKTVLDVVVEPVVIERIDIPLDSNFLTIYENSSMEALYSLVPPDADKDTLIWSSDNPDIASVKNGIIYGMSLGSTVIRVSSPSGYAKAVIDVQVKENLNILFEPDTSELNFDNGVSSKSINISNNGEVYNVTYKLTGDTESFSIDETSSGIKITSNENKSILPKNAVLQIFSRDGIVLKDIALNQSANPSPVFTQIWVRGVTPHKAAMDTDEYGFFQWNEIAGEGWYNVVKLEAKAIASSPDSRMCWAMTASNILHWWFEQNKDLVAQYEIKTGRKCNYGYFLENKGENEKDVSEIGKLFREKFPNKGGYVDNGINWFLGHPSRPLTEGSPLCFEEAFTDLPKNIVETKILYKLKDFSREVKYALENGKALGLDYALDGGGHAITVWGAEFDEEGIVRNIYIVDSNYPYHVMTTLGVYEQDGLTYLRNLNTPDYHTNWRVIQISTVDLMQDVLKAYLEK